MKFYNPSWLFVRGSLIMSFLLVFLLSFPVFAGRPVYHTLTRNELEMHSNFIFEGEPSDLKAAMECKYELGRWKVLKVQKGDKSLEGKVIGVAAKNYQLFAAVGKGRMPSYAAYRYKDGNLNTSKVRSVLYTTRNKDGCFELAADGAQEFPEKKPESVKGLTNSGSAFTLVKIQESCAPHDASSWMLSFLGEKNEYPRLQVNWWKNKPKADGGSFSISGHGSMEEGFQAYYCAQKGQCAMLKNIRVDLRWPKDAKEGMVKFSFTPENGKEENGELPFQVEENQQPVLCG